MDMEQLLAEVQRLTSMVQQQQAQLNNSQSPGPVLETGPKPPKEKLPTLRVFNGDRNDWEEWHLAARNKLRADGTAIGSPFLQFLYLSARVEGKSAKMVKSYVDYHSTQGTGNAPDFLSYLEKIYADPNKKARAMQILFSLKQGDKETFANFLPRFETVLADAGGLEFTDGQRVNYLKNCLNMKMRPYLVSVAQGLSENYNGFVDQCQNIGSELAAIEIVDRNNRHYTPSARQLTGSDTPKEPWNRRTQRNLKGQEDLDKMDWEPAKPLRTNRSTVETNGRRAKWVGPETMAYRREKRLCFRCGNPGYVVDDCKFLPP